MNHLECEIKTKENQVLSLLEELYNTNLLVKSDIYSDYKLTSFDDDNSDDSSDSSSDDDTDYASSDDDVFVDIFLDT